MISYSASNFYDGKITPSNLNKNSTLKSVNTEYANLSTSRVSKTIQYQRHNKSINQFCTDEKQQESQRSVNKEWFQKMQNLEFQNDMFQMQMQHINRRKQNEDNQIKSQLFQLQQEIDGIRTKFSSNKKEQRTPKRSIRRKDDSELSSDAEDSSTSRESIYYGREIRQINYDVVFRQFQQLFDICCSNNKLSTLFLMYCGSLQTIQLDLQNQNFTAVLENVLKMFIDLLLKLSAIKLDSLLIRESTPERGVSNYEFDTFQKDKRMKQEDSLSPAFNSNDEVSEMRMKLSDQYSRFDQDSKDEYIKIENPMNRQTKRQSISSDPQNSLPQEMFKSVKNKGAPKKIELMPSLKQKRNKKE
ncbi:hypothetical protein pb186bvf_003836 [Paramecium bursaria]